MDEFNGQTCGIYPRVSTQKQARSDRTSLEDQTKACRAYALATGMAVDEMCVKPEPYTSTKMQRPELNDLLRIMQAHRVANLVIDRVDRMTRAGQLAAVQFLQQFTRAGITLHIVSMAYEDDLDDDEDERHASALVLRKHDDKAVKDFLDAAYAAQEDNKKRVRIVKRAKRSRAKKGHYLRGSRAPYGFRHEPVEWDAHGIPTHYKMVPDTVSYAERGFPLAATFAPNPHEARRRMVRLYAEGYSPKRIREMLVAAGVPTATAMTPRAGGAGEWYPRTVWMLVNNPLNEGKLYNFRHKNVPKDPDERHEDEWTQQAPVPLDKQILVEPKYGSPDPLVDEDTARALERRRETGNKSSRPWAASRYGEYALLATGRGRCMCGDSLYVNRTNRRGYDYLYYHCSKGRSFSELPCHRWSIRVDIADPIAWLDLTTALSTLDRTSGDNYMDVLAKAQLEYDRTPQADGALSDLEAALELLQRQYNDAHADYRRAQTSMVKASLLKDMERSALAIDEAERKIAARRQQAMRLDERREVLNTYLTQYRRYVDALWRIEPSDPAHMPLMIELARRVGATWTLKSLEPIRPHTPSLQEPDPFSVGLAISPDVAQPWFTTEQEERLALDPWNGGVVESGDPTTPEDSRVSEFGKAGTSLGRKSSQTSQPQ
jgi:DNA invertase Pin-like site-specific DNA recombinase